MFERMVSQAQTSLLAVLPPPGAFCFLCACIMSIIVPCKVYVYIIKDRKKTKVRDESRRRACEHSRLCTLYEMWVGMRASVTDTVHTHRRLFLLGSPSRAFLGCVAQNAVASSLFSLFCSLVVLLLAHSHVS